MKIGIISDTHGCHERFSLAFDKYFKDADMIIHAGDVLYHGPRNPMLSDYNPAKLAEKLNACSMPVVICRGNCDSEVDTLVLDMPIQAPYTYVVAEGLKIVTTHGHYVETDEAKDKMDIRSSTPIKDDSKLTPNLEQTKECCSAKSFIKGTAMATFESISCLSALDKNLTEESCQTLCK